MLRRDRQIRAQIHQLADAMLFAFSFWAAYALRDNPQIAGWFNLDPISSATTFDNLAWLYLAIIIGAPLVLESQNFYNRAPLCPRADFLWPLLKGCLLTTFGLAVTTYAFRMNSVVPRGMTTFFMCISFLAVWGKEEVVRLILLSNVAQSQLKRRFILVGSEKEIARMRTELDARNDESVAIVAQFDLTANALPDLIQMLHDHSAFGVILNARHTYFEQVENVIKACELEGVEVWLVADFFSTQISRTTLDEMLGHPLLIFRTAPEISWQSLAKHVIDFTGALLLLILTAPVLFLPIAIFIKLTSPGPVFFRQQRSGQNGAPFTLYKFRTMVTNAEQLKDELASMNEMTGPVFKVTNDPRVTSFGKFLRKWSLDELPQLFNVLRGEMSLVGPRPLPVDEVKRFNDLSHRRRLSVKPGLTCLWQIKGRNQISDFKDWVRLDLEYIDNWSLWLDIKILLLTLPAVLRGTGAK
jgi:exopolysaccharide biosynthesis polyprenyl glycosylphosphotransferase